MLPAGVSLQELVNGLNALGIGPRDMITILQMLAPIFATINRRGGGPSEKRLPSWRTLGKASGGRGRDGRRPARRAAPAAERLARATEANAVALRAGIEAKLATGWCPASPSAVQEQHPRSGCYHADGRTLEAEATGRRSR